MLSAPIRGRSRPRVPAWGRTVLPARRQNVCSHFDLSRREDDTMDTTYDPTHPTCCDEPGKLPVHRIQLMSRAYGIPEGGSR